MITVHHLDDSRSQRIIWLLEELGEPYEIEQHRRDPVTRAAPAALKEIHPLGKSPVIEDNGRVVSESGAIIEHILRRYGKGRLQPTVDDPQYDEYIHWMHYAEGSAMPALIIRINIGRMGEVSAPLGCRGCATAYLYQRSARRQAISLRQCLFGGRYSIELRWRTRHGSIWSL
jgi:glutathione S-transferase